MATPIISLAQFNKIASGDYNAGLVDFKTDDNGNVQNALKKVNNHVDNYCDDVTLDILSQKCGGADVLIATTHKSATKFISPTAASVNRGDVWPSRRSGNVV